MPLYFGAADMVKSEPPESWKELQTSHLGPFNSLHALIHQGSAIVVQQAKKPFALFYVGWRVHS